MESNGFMSEDNAKTIDIKLEKAASSGDVEGVIRGLAEGGDPNHASGLGLANAAYSGYEEIVKLLLEHGADVDLALAGHEGSTVTCRRLREYRERFAEHAQAYIEKQERIRAEFNGYEKDTDHSVIRREKHDGGQLTLKHVFNFQTRQVTTVALDSGRCGVNTREFADFSDTAQIEEAYAMFRKQGGGDFDWNTRQVNKKKSGVKIG